MPYIAVAIQSALCNGKNREFYFYILENGISEKNKNQLRRICNKFGSKIEFCYIDGSEFKDAPLSRFQSTEPYFRLLIPHLFPELSKAVYLDGDILVRGDLGELFECDMNGYPLAACDDVSATKHMKRLGLKSYFNSGVLLMDLEKWRRENLFDRCMNCLEKERGRLLFEDQDTINVAMVKKIHCLSITWNLFSIFFSKSLKPSFYSSLDIEKAKRKANIIHFAGIYKPFYCQNSHRINLMYFKYALKTPYLLNLLLRATKQNLSFFKWSLGRVFEK